MYYICSPYATCEIYKCNSTQGVYCPIMIMQQQLMYDNTNITDNNFIHFDNIGTNVTNQSELLGSYQNLNEYEYIQNWMRLLIDEYLLFLPFSQNEFNYLVENFVDIYQQLCYVNCAFFNCG